MGTHQGCFDRIYDCKLVYERTSDAVKQHHSLAWIWSKLHSMFVTDSSARLQGKSHCGRVKSIFLAVQPLTHLRSTWHSLFPPPHRIDACFRIFPRKRRKNNNEKYHAFHCSKNVAPHRMVFIRFVLHLQLNLNTVCGMWKRTHSIACQRAGGSHACESHAGRITLKCVCRCYRMCTHYSQSVRDAVRPSHDYYCLMYRTQFVTIIIFISCAVTAIKVSIHIATEK